MTASRKARRMSRMEKAIESIVEHAFPAAAGKARDDDALEKNLSGQLLHQMVHIASNDQRHGPHFRREVAHIVKMWADLWGRSHPNTVLLVNQDARVSLRRRPKWCDLTARQATELLGVAYATLRNTLTKRQILALVEKEGK